MSKKFSEKKFFFNRAVWNNNGITGFIVAWKRPGNIDRISSIHHAYFECIFSTLLKFFSAIIMSLFIVSVKKWRLLYSKNPPPSIFHEKKTLTHSTIFLIRWRKVSLSKQSKIHFFAHLSKRLKVGICYHLLSVIMWAWHACLQSLNKIFCQQRLVQIYTRLHRVFLVAIFLDYPDWLWNWALPCNY